MGQKKLREGNTCLNCGAIVEARYCPVCGQENIELKESFQSLIGHFIADIIHFDGKFFTTTRYLFTRPGFLSQEYLIGRRARYFHPIRMYVFSSALFFLVFFSLFIKELMPVSTGEHVPNVPVTGQFDSIQQYDSLQTTLPKAQRDGWLYRKVMHKTIELSQRYQEDGISLLKEAGNKFIHTFPYLLFISLPLYALYLKMLYRKQKHFFYTDHAVFLLHLYIFTFLLLLVMMFVYILNRYAVLGWMQIIYFTLLMHGVFYAYLSMLRFYGQTSVRTLLKFILFNILTLVSLVILFSIFFIIAVMQV